MSSKSNPKTQSVSLRPLTIDNLNRTHPKFPTIDCSLVSLSLFFAPAIVKGVNLHTNIFPWSLTWDRAAFVHVETCSSDLVSHCGESLNLTRWFRGLCISPAAPSGTFLRVYCIRAKCDCVYSNGSRSTMPYRSTRTNEARIMIDPLPRGCIDRFCDSDSRFLWHSEFFPSKTSNVIQIRNLSASSYL